MDGVDGLLDRDAFFIGSIIVINRQSFDIHLSYMGLTVFEYEITYE